MNKAYLISAVVASGAMCASASAGLLSHSGSLPTTVTNWSTNIDVPQFDDLGGTRVLKTVSIFLEGTVSGTAKGESLDNAPTTVDLFLQANITLSLGASNLAVIIPVANASFGATAHDGVIDFGGTSGATFSNLNASDSIKELLALGTDDLSPWIGLGNVSLTGAATGTSSGSGAGNLLLQFATDASLGWTIEYNFNVVPAPGAAALFGLAGAGMIRRRR